MNAYIWLGIALFIGWMICKYILDVPGFFRAFLHNWRCGFSIKDSIVIAFEQVK